MKITGLALHDSFEGGREAVQISIQNNLVTITSQTPGQVQAQFFLNRGKYFLGGNQDSLLFIEHPDLRDVKVYCDFKGDIKQLFLKDTQLRELLGGKLKQSQQRHRVSWGVFSTVVIAIILVIVYRGPIFGSMVNLIPFSTEKKVADQVLALRGKSSQTENLADQKLAEMTKSLLAADPAWQDLITFHISSGTEVNAYATFGGHIFIMRGLIDKMESAEQLLGVIAHELAHAKERHVTKSVFQGLGLFAIIQTLLGDITGLVTVLADQGGALFMAQHSRALESEADRKAVEYLIKARVNPQGLVQALRILQKETQKMLEQTPGGDLAKILSKAELWSSHPEMDRRIAELEAFIKEHMKSADSLPPLEVDYPDFVEVVRKSY